MENDDGHIFQDGMRVVPKSDAPGQNTSDIYYPVRAVVRKVYFVDDDQNGPGDTILCDCYCIDQGLILPKVPLLGSRISYDNYIYHSLKEPTRRLDGKQFDSNDRRPYIEDGDSVLILFANGKIQFPYIIATVPHPQSGFDGNTFEGKEIFCPDPRPTRADGDCYKIRMNGTVFLIDKDGMVTWYTTNTVDKNIPKRKKFLLTLNEKDDSDAPKTQKCEMEIDDTGEGKFCIRVVKADGKTNSYCIDAQNNKVEIVNTNATGTQKITLDDSGLKFDVKGDIVYTATGNLTFTVNTTVFNVTGDLTMTASGNAKFSGSGGTTVGSSGSTTKVDGSSVELAGGGQPVARLGDQAVGTGNLGAPVISNITQGSAKCTSG